MVLKHASKCACVLDCAQKKQKCEHMCGRSSALRDIFAMICAAGVC